MRKIKAIVYGVGEMGRMMTTIMVEKGIEIVGAIDSYSHIGKDLGEVAGLGYPLNVIISDDADAVISSTGADIAVMSFCSDMTAMFPPTKKCIENGLNVISITEESFYPLPTSPEITAEIDRLAKQYGVTVTGDGIQDIIWSSVPAVLTGASSTITSMTCQTVANSDDYGPVVAEQFFIGETLESFERKIQEQPLEQSFLGIAIIALIDDFGLTIKEKKHKVEPLLVEEEMNCIALGRMLKKGEIYGATHIDEITTEEGIDFRGEELFKVYKGDETDTTKWFVKGNPDLYLELPKLPGRIATCTPTVNRIPHVINSAPGYVTVGKLPKIMFRAHPLHYYLDK